MLRPIIDSESYTSALSVTVLPGTSDVARFVSFATDLPVGRQLTTPLADCGHRDVILDATVTPEAS
jgi:hypothetical protein